MADARLDPPLSMPTYAVRAPLARWLADEARSAYTALGRYRLLDVGCGEMPYRSLFDPYAAIYVGVDPVENPRAELRGPIEALPVDDASFDVVLCAQVLEHVDDPTTGVRELHRVTAPGGRVLVSTHGAMVYHPNPVDLWRWTAAGLERLFADNGDWASIRVTPASGSAACVAMLTAIYLDHAFRRLRAAALGRPLIAAVNAAAAAVDRRVDLREPRPGTISANYHVVAERGP